MSQKLSAEEVAVVIKAKKILKAQGLSPDTDIKTICQAAGISRKTGYQRANKLMPPSDLKEQGLREQLEQLKAEHEDLKKRFDDVRFENEGRKIAWEIHEIDKLLAEKKSTMNRVKNKRR
jgi:predicted DNA-binding transcriptional regulator AlpA